MRYENAVRKIYARPRLARLLRAVSHAATLLSAALLFVTLGIAFSVRPMLSISLLVSVGVPFVAVSVLRRILNFPRPYEVYDFGGELSGRKSGKSFPSRHVFSAFAIATATATVSVPLSLLGFLVGVLLGLARVLLGIHFPKDAATGAILGVLGAFIGFIAFGII